MEEKYNAWQCPLNARTHLYHSEGVIAWVLGSCFLLPIPSADPQLVDSRPPISVNLFKPQTLQDMSCGWGGITISKSGTRSRSISLHRCISLQLDSNTLLHLQLQKKHLMDEQRPHPVGSSLLGSWRPQVNQAPGQPWSGSRFQVNLDQVPGFRLTLIRFQVPGQSWSGELTREGSLHDTGCCLQAGEQQPMMETSLGRSLPNQPNLTYRLQLSREKG